MSQGVPQTSSSSFKPASHVPPLQPPAPGRPNPRPTQRRAAQACLQCRMRKVRCDVMLRTPPCTNCSLDGVECKIVSSFRRRPPEREKQEIAHISPAQSSRSHTGSLGESQANLSEASPTLQHSAHGPYSDFQSRADSALTHPPRPDRDDYLQTVLSSSNGEKRFSASQGRAIAIPDNYAQRNSARPSSRNQTHYQKDTYLPDYIQSFLVPRPEDLEYLHGRGVFVLLPFDLQVLVLDQFEQFIYPMVPIFDIVRFRHAMCGSDQVHKIPLILYHAVMFLGLGIMENDLILRYLYAPMMSAREAFYQKTKALYDLNVEHDRMVLCQISILLVERTDIRDPKNFIFWIGNAISHAHDIKLYRQDSDPPSAGEQNWRKIMWWTILIKECILCMGFPQPPRVWPFGTPMLTMRDFALPDAGASGVNIDIQALQSPSSALALIYIFTAKMFNQMYFNLQTIHEEIGGFSGRPFSGPLISQRHRMRQLLFSWYSEVPPGWWMRNLVESGVVDTQPSLAWAVAITEFLYWSAQILICKDEMLVEMSPHTKPEFMAGHVPQIGYNWQPLQQAANGMIDVVERALSCNIAQFFPPSFLHPTFMAAAVQFRDANSRDPDIRQRGLHRIGVCVEIAQCLQKRYPSLSETVSKMEQALKTRQARLAPEQQDATSASESQPSLMPIPASNLAEMAPHSYLSGNGSGWETNDPKAPEYGAMYLDISAQVFDWALADLGV